MVNKLRKVFLVSFVLAVFIFLLGMYLGYTLDTLRINSVNEMLYENELNTLNYLSSKEFLDLFDKNDSCGSTQILLENMGPEISNLGNTLIFYEKRNLFNSGEYKLLKMKYFLVELRAYVLFVKLKKECGYDFDVILYFYDQNHDKSTQQGYILDTLVKSSSNVNVLSFDRNLVDSDVVNLLIKHYNITISPTVIINNDIKLEGLTSLEDFRKII
jgi:hypothetical protein